MEAPDKQSFDASSAPVYRQTPAMGWLLGLAAFVVIVAGMRASQELIVPFLASLFLTVICYPPLEWMQKKGLPTWLALIVIILVVSVSLLVVVAVVGTSLQDLTSHIGEYKQQLDNKKTVLLDWIADRGYPQVKENLKDRKVFSPEGGVRLLTMFLSSLAGLFGDVFWVLLITVFMLLEASTVPEKLAEISRSGPERDRSGQVDQIRNAVWQYATLKTLISLMVGAGVVVLLKILAVDYALLWGLLAFFFNFIPNIGSVIAAVPGVAMALIQYDFRTAIYATIGYVVINLVFSNIVEPRVMGKGMGISALVVFLSLIFWGWVLGPVGMILSVPLTMIVKIVLENSEQGRWIAILLSGESPGSERVPTGK
jgi:predicted PurR-regulated permease PerM